MVPAQAGALDAALLLVAVGALAVNRKYDFGTTIYDDGPFGCTG